MPEDDLLDVIDLVALGQIVVATVIDQSDAADVDGLLADDDLAPPDIDVGIAERGQDLRYGDIESFKSQRIDPHFKFLGGTAPAVDVDDAGYRGEPP